jgi:glyoxylase-like metal-dependent hydrolase (beta-lactamase superfamily II)
MNDSLSSAVLEIDDTPPLPGDVRGVAPGIVWLRMPLPFALDHINLWLIEQPGGYALVDCGYGDATTRASWGKHFDTTFAQRGIDRIVVTHCHPDHLGNAAWLAARFGCTVTMTQGEYLVAHALLEGQAGYAQADVRALFVHHGMPVEHVAAIADRANHYRRGVPEAPQTFDRLVGGDTLTLGSRCWRVIPGYGHSTEHAALADVEARVLIAGDMLLPRISTNVAVWASEPDADPVQRFLDSLAAFETLAPDTLVLPSHGLPFRGIGARVGQLRAHHAARLAELHRFLVEAGVPKSAHDAIPVLFRRELDMHQRFFAIGEAIAHLNHLWRTGRAKREVRDDGAIRFTAE